MYEIEILGRIPSKKNQKRIVRSKGRPIIISSKQHDDWHKQQEKALQEFANENITFPCRFIYEFTMPDNRKCDISNKIESINDLLVDIGFIEDDNWTIIKSFTARVIGVDKENAGCRIRVDEL